MARGDYDSEELKIKASCLTAILATVVFLAGMVKCGGTDKESVRANAEVKKVCIEQGCSWTIKNINGGFTHEVCICGCCPND